MGEETLFLSTRRDDEGAVLIRIEDKKHKCLLDLTARNSVELSGGLLRVARMLMGDAYVEAVQGGNTT